MKKVARNEFLNKFVTDAEVILSIPDVVKRADTAVKVYDARLAYNSSEWPEPFIFKILRPGLINYDDTKAIGGTVYMQKAALDAMCNSWEGKPIVNVVHKDVQPEELLKKAGGIITSNAWFNPEDGWYYVRGFVWDAETKLNCRNAAYSNSCAFTLDEITGPGETQKVPYKHEMLRGTGAHLAIVSNPRLEGAANFEERPTPKSALNHKEEGKMSSLLTWFKNLTDKKEARNAMKVDPVKHYRVINGKKVALHELAEEFKKDRSEAAEREAVEKDREKEMGEDEVIDIDEGVSATVKELEATYTRRMAKNAEEEKLKAENAAKDAHAKGEHEKARVEGCADCKVVAENALKIVSLEKDHKEGKHAEGTTVENCSPCSERAKITALNAAHETKGHEAEFFKECPACAALGEKAFNELKEARNAHKPDVTVRTSGAKSMEERAAEGTKAHTI